MSERMGTAAKLLSATTICVGIFLAKPAFADTFDLSCNVSTPVGRTGSGLEIRNNFIYRVNTDAKTVTNMSSNTAEYDVDIEQYSITFKESNPKRENFDPDVPYVAVSIDRENGGVTITYSAWIDPWGDHRPPQIWTGVCHPAKAQF